MGTDFKCGCRCSANHWFLCEKHENLILAEGVFTDEDEENDE